MPQNGMSLFAFLLNKGDELTSEQVDKKTSLRVDELTKRQVDELAS